MEEECQELEELNNRHDTSNLHEKLKELTGNKRRRRPHNTRDNNKGVVTDESKIKLIWEQYPMQMFEDERENEDMSREEWYLQILSSEIKYATKNAKKEKLQAQMKFQWNYYKS